VDLSRHLKAPVQAAACAAGLASAALGPPSRAEPVPEGGVTADQVAAVLRDKGYAAQISKDSTGDPQIRSGAEGVSFTIYFYGCQQGPRCASIEFSSAYHVEAGMKLADVNGWNLKNRYGRSYIDSVNDPHMEMDLSLEHGGTTEAIGAAIETWDSVLASFQHMVRCASAPSTEGCAPPGSGK
jgi:hypothetical protein